MKHDPSRGPTYSQELELGEIAEATVARAVKSWGHVYRPTTGPDFGVDGQVDVIGTGGEVLGAGFQVQVKGSKDAWNATNEFLARRIKTSTALLWMRNVVPTMVIAYDQVTDTLYYTWALGEIARSLENALKNGAATLTVRVPRAQVLDRAAFGREVDFVLAHRKELKSLAAEGMTRRHGLELYRAASNCAEIITERLIAETVMTPGLREVTRIPPQEEEGRRNAWQKAQAFALVPPKSLQPGHPMHSIQAIGCLFELLDSYVATASELRLEDVSPIVRLSQVLVWQLQAYLRQGLGDENRDVADRFVTRTKGQGSKDQLSLNGVYGPRFFRSLALMMLSIRDFLRAVREVAFPGVIRTEDGNPDMQLDTLARHVLGEASSWLPDGAIN